VEYDVDLDVRLRSEFESALATRLASLDEPLVPLNRDGEYALRPPAD
jgi:hypothetical protein